MLFKLFLYLILIKLSLSNECGKAKFGVGLSVGAEFSGPGEWPWLASLFMSERYICGSTVISKRFLLGAAHCVAPKGHSNPIPTTNYFAYLGRYDLNNKNDPNSIKKTFLNIFVHPEWDSMSTKYDGDISLFLMKSEVAFNNFVQPICLPSASSKVFDVTGTVAGYGLTEESRRHENRPKHIEIKSVEHPVCLFAEHSFVAISSLRMFCAGMKGKNPCKGDSGGPFMVKEDNKWTINGIVSAAVDRECHENDFVLFTQVPLFVGWINHVTEEDHSFECTFKPNECDNQFLRILQPNLRVTSITGKVEPQTFSDINTIVFNSAEINYLPDFSIANSKFPNLRQLYITNSKLKEVDKSKLAILPQLTLFNVYGNEIKKLHENVFDDLTNLEMLAFVKNQIKILPQKLLWNLPKLKELWAWENQIEAIPPRFFKNSLKLEKVWLQSNKIAQIGVVLRSLPKLNLIDLRWNKCIDKQVQTNFDEFQMQIDEKC